MRAHTLLAKLTLSLAAALLVGCGGSSSASSPTAPPTPRPASLQAQVDALVGPGIAAGRWASLVVGVYDRGTTTVFPYGRVTPGGPVPDERTVYEIGSITKTFTAALLAGLDRENRVRLDDPLRLHLPATTRVPAYRGEDVTLLHLATHSSGLPRLPDDLNRTPGFDPANPYAHYGLDRLLAFLSRTSLARAPGSRYEYSNLGYALLGQSLAFEVDAPWEEAVRLRVTQPLGLLETRVDLDADLQARLAPGHDERGQPAHKWDLAAHAPAGALRSTARDMLRYLVALLGHGPEPATGDLLACRQPRFAPPGQQLQLGLAWHLLPLGTTGRTYVGHDGGTGGYASFVAYLPERDAGLVILASSANEVVTAGQALLEWLAATP